MVQKIEIAIIGSGSGGTNSTEKMGKLGKLVIC